MATAFFGSDFFGGEFFSSSQMSPKTDDEDGRHPIAVKPTGLLERRPTLTLRKTVEQRVDESRQIQAEVYGQLAKELRAEREKPVIQEMSLREIEAEIGELLRKKLRTEDEEIMLLLLVAAAG